MAALREADGFSGLRDALRSIGEQREDWAGVPMPLQDMRLIIEPRYPKAKELMAIGSKPDDDDDYDSKCIMRNSFICHVRRIRVLLWNEPSGKIEWGIRSAFHSLGHQLSTLSASVAWGVEQEAMALQTLATMLRHHQFKQYLLAGAFLETSKRSGLTYMFRKLRPTIAISYSKKEPRIISTLCLHPIGYYDGSFGGAMTPTDDVIAHLSLMRADEHFFWKKSNQHAPTHPEAGL